uniref:Interleukin 15, like n=1 Tax=Sinocyclocheilus rhinocerous TaxID=307959 RepID=A0A673H4M1_9TELE
MRTDLLHYSMRFTSLFLYLLIMLTRQIKCQPVCSKESVEMVKRIARELSQVKNDSMLYTPTLADYELQDKMKPCPDCEFYQEERADTFLETLQNVLQQMNAEKRCAPEKNKRH